MRCLAKKLCAGMSAATLLLSMAACTSQSNADPSDMAAANPQGAILAAASSQGSALLEIPTVALLLPPLESPEAEAAESVSPEGAGEEGTEKPLTGNAGSQNPAASTPTDKTNPGSQKPGTDSSEGGYEIGSAEDPYYDRQYDSNGKLVMRLVKHPVGNTGLTFRSLQELEKWRNQYVFDHQLDEFKGSQWIVSGTVDTWSCDYPTGKTLGPNQYLDPELYAQGSIAFRTKMSIGTSGKTFDSLAAAKAWGESYAKEQAAINGWNWYGVPNRTDPDGRSVNYWVVTGTNKWSCDMPTGGTY